MAILIPVDPRTDRDNWLAMRRKGIGSSDAAACVGLSANEIDPDPDARALYAGAFASPYMVFHNKVNGIELPVDDQVDWGNRLELAIGDACQDYLGVELTRPVGIHQSEEVPWRLATNDRLTPAQEPVELKNVRMARGWGRTGTNDVPGKYLAQITHQMMVMGVEQGFIGALIGGCDFRMFHVRRNESFARLLHESEEALWDMIQRGEAPDPDYTHPRTEEVLKLLWQPTPNSRFEYQDCDGPELTLYMDAAKDYVRLGREASAAEKLRRECRNKLLELMGTYSAVSLPDGTVIERKLVEMAGHPVKPHTQTRMTVTLAK